MRHIKLFESWLNEAKTVNVPMVLDNGLKYIQTEYDGALKDLSQFGNLAKEIRSYTNDYRSQYLSSGVWSSVNTKQGLESSIQDFKKLYYEATAGYGETQTAIRMLAIKLYSSDPASKIWNSKEAVNAAKIIQNGNPNLSKSIAAGIILSQLAFAITKGLYYYSANIPYTVGEERAGFSDPDVADRWLAIKKLKGVFDVATSSDMQKNYDLGKDYFSQWKVVTKTVPYTPGTHGRTMVRKEDVDEFQVNMEKIKPYIDKLSLETIVSKENLKQNLWVVADSLYSFLFIGNYIGSQMQSSMEQFSQFMERGGPTWYQKIIG